MAGNGATRKAVIVTGVITLAIVVGSALAVPPLLAAAEPAASRSPEVPPTPVISATPVPESRRTQNFETMTPELEAEIWEKQGPEGTAIDQVRTMFPEDYAYGYITDEGFGMSFKGDAPLEALAILDAVGDPYDLHEHVGFTELEIEPQLTRVVELVEAAVGDQSFVTGTNVFTVTVEVELHPDTDDTALEGAALDQLIEDIRPELYPGFDIAITSTPGVEIGW